MSIGINNIESTVKHGNLLIVDDDKLLLQTMVKMFEKHYNVKVAESGPEALQIIHSGYKPGVIVSDHVMPKMSGAEFLEKSMDTLPESIKIIMTADSSPKTIIMSINQAHAYMFIKKPFDNLELIQAVRLAFNAYNQKLRTKQKIDSLQSDSVTLENKILNYQTSINQIIIIFNSLIKKSEKFYYTDHTSSVRLIAKAISEKMGMGQSETSVLMQAVLLHNFPVTNLPESLFLANPNELEADDKVKYSMAFNNTISSLKKIEALKNIADILAAMWEHQDGSGYPKLLMGSQIPVFSHIIHLANYYHNMVYGVPYNEYLKTRGLGKLFQNKAVTRLRHDEVIRFLYRKASWFNIDVFTAFQELASSKSCDALTPADHNLEYTVGEPFPFQKDEEEESRDRGAASPFGRRKKKISVEKDVHIEDIEEGMVLSQNVVTKKGILVVRYDNTLDASKITKIKTLFNSGMINDHVSIKVKE